MMLSMTGFGKAEISLNQLHLQVEIRSLNSKYLDLSVKIPSFLKALELDARKLIKEHLKRGKVELLIHYEKNENQSNVSLNTTQISAYYEQLAALNDKLQGGLKIDLLGHTLKLPDTIHHQKDNLEDSDLQKILSGISEACSDLNNFRRNEGKSLHAELVGRIENIQQLAQKVIPFESERLPKVKAKILEAINTLNQKSQIDEKRLEQELIFYAEKLDITEEKVRLNEHCDHFLKTMRDEGAGKKLGFITQEIGREINTLGSKAHHLDIQKLVVEMKDELEKIKEQILNVL